MNAKLLFAATVAASALSLATTLVMAADATGPLTRAEVKADAIAAPTTIQPRGELYGEPGLRSTAPSGVRRSEVVAELAADRAAHPYDNVGERSGQSPVSRYAAPSQLARAEVKAEVRHAMADGTLMRQGEFDEVTAGTAHSHPARPHLAFLGR